MIDGPCSVPRMALKYFLTVNTVSLPLICYVREALSPSPPGLLEFT